MNTFLHKADFAVAGSWLALVLLLGLAPAAAHAASVRDIAPTAADAPVMLDAENPNFGNFASFTSAPRNRLIVTVGAPGEIVNFGLSPEYNRDGDPYTNTSVSRYRFRVRRITEDGSNPVVHGPFTIDNSNANVNSWAEAEFGVYDQTATQNGEEIYVFRPDQAGDYSIEFTDLAPDVNDRILIPFWDFTVTNAAGNVQEGRTWARSWSFRTPPVTGGDLPLCEWDRAFNGQFYSYTEDGFVSLIDFADAGFAGLSFDIAFNSTGPGTTGDLLEDRKSVPGVNATGNAAEHRVFLSLPDESLFPEGECGEASFGEAFRCDGANTYCLEVQVTNPGQVQIVLDFDGNGQLDEDGLDVLLAQNFTGDELASCIPWDGLRGDGTPVEVTDTVDIIVNYSQGVQHYSAYDVEFMRNGFCVETIRPTCAQEISSNVLYWDDRDIPEDPGTGTTKDNREGADCRELPRTWDNFNIAAGQDCLNFNDDETEGYGDKSTLNTYWFANVVQTARVRIAAISIAIEGDLGICEGGTTTLTAVSQADNQELTSFSWNGPGVVDVTTESIEVSEAGEYCVTVTTDAGCMNTICATVDVIDFQTEQFPPALSVCFGDTVRLDMEANEDFSYEWSPTTGLDDPNSNNPIFFPTETTTYTVIVSNNSATGNQCSATETLTVTVSPEIGLAVDGGGPICEPTSAVTVTAADDVTFELRDSDDNLLVTETGSTATFNLDVSGVANYTVTAINDDGCTETAMFDVTGGPVDIAIADTVVSCLTEELILTVQNLDINDELTYSFTPADLFEAGTANTANPVFVGGSGQYTVTVMATNQFGCEASDVIELFVIDENDLLSFETTPDCDGLTVMFDNTSTIDFGFLYDFGDGNFSTDADPTNVYPSAGEYEVTLGLIVDQDCIAEFTRTVTVTEGVEIEFVINGPDGPLTGPGSPAAAWVADRTSSFRPCARAATPTEIMVELEDDVQGEVTISYTDINGNPLGNGSTITLTSNASDTVIVTATNEQNCMTMDTIVIQNSSVDAAVDAGADGLSFCSSTDTTITVFNNNPGDTLSYAWEDNDIITGPLDEENVTITSPAEGSVDLSVMVTNQFGCDTTLTVTVSAVPFTPNDFPDVVTPCFAQAFTIMGGPAVEGYIYEYETGQNLDESDPANPIGNFTSDTEILVTITDPQTGCQSIQTIMVDVQPEISFMVMPSDSTVCEPGMVTVTGTTVNEDAEITWYSDAELQNAIATGETVVVDAAEVGESYTVFGQAIDPTTGCEQTVPVTIEVSDVSTGLPTGPINACAGDDSPMIFTGGGQNPDLDYTFDPADVVGMDDDDNFTFVGQEDQTITVTATDATTGCSATTTIEATFRDLTGLAGVPPSDTIFLGQEATFSVEGCDGDSCVYNWMGDNGTITPGDGQQVTIEPDEAGTFMYTSTVESAGCTGEVTVELRVEDPICNTDFVFVPNAFSPNGDNINDELRVRSNFAEQLTEFRWIVYDRWGQEVYSSDDVNGSWDGTTEGDDLEPDVYGYWLRVVCPSGEPLVQQGNITILR